MQTTQYSIEPACPAGRLPDDEVSRLGGNEDAQGTEDGKIRLLRLRLRLAR